MSAPRFFEIRVKSHLGTGWATWFEGLTIRHPGKGETVLSGTMDQAALHGTLAKIRDLGLTLLSVLPGGEQENDNTDGREK